MIAAQLFNHHDELDTVRIKAISQFFQNKELREKGKYPPKK